MPIWECDCPTTARAELEPPPLRGRPGSTLARRQAIPAGAVGGPLLNALLRDRLSINLFFVGKIHGVRHFTVRDRFWSFRSRQVRTENENIAKTTV